MKLGQWAATRPDLLSPVWILFLSELHDRAPTHSFAETLHQIQGLPYIAQKGNICMTSEGISQKRGNCMNGGEALSIRNEKCRFKGDNTPLNFLFEWIDEEPIGSGTMGQVHVGRLTEAAYSIYLSNFIQQNPFYRSSDGKLTDELLGDPKNVAIKVLHPGILDSLVVDMALISTVATLLDTFCESLRWLQLPLEVNQLTDLLVSQVDLRREASHLLKFR